MHLPLGVLSVNGNIQSTTSMLVKSALTPLRSTEEEEMEVDVRIPAPLKKLAGEQDVIKSQGKTVGEVLRWLTDTYPGLEERLRDEKGEVRRFINIYVNGEDIRFTLNLQTPLKEGDQISIIPAIAGGSSFEEE